MALQSTLETSHPTDVARGVALVPAPARLTAMQDVPGHPSNIVVVQLVGAEDREEKGMLVVTHASRADKQAVLHAHETLSPKGMLRPGALSVALSVAVRVVAAPVDALLRVVLRRA